MLAVHPVTSAHGVASPPMTPLSTTRRRALRATLVAAIFASPASAQPTFPTNDATLARIWRLGMDSSQVQRLAQTLFDSIGPRLTGSPGMLAASDWTIKQYQSWGIDAKREQYG